MIPALLLVSLMGQGVYVNDGKITIHNGRNTAGVSDAGGLIVTCPDGTCSGGGGGSSATMVSIDGGPSGTLGVASIQSGSWSMLQSGTWTVGLSAGSNVIGHVIVDTAPTTAVTGTFWQSTQPVTADGGRVGALDWLDGGVIDQVLSVGWVDGGNINAQVSGTVTASQGGAPWAENITKVGGANLALGATTAANAIPVVQATDAPNQCAQNGTWNVNAIQSGAWAVSASNSLGSNFHVNVDSAPSTAVTGTFWQSIQPVGGLDGGLLLETGIDPGGVSRTLLTNQLGAQYTVSAPPLPLPPCNPVRRFNCK